jgi:hypothetical protein
LGSNRWNLRKCSIKKETEWLTSSEEREREREREREKVAGVKKDLVHRSLQKRLRKSFPHRSSIMKTVSKNANWKVK